MSPKGSFPARKSQRATDWKRMPFLELQELRSYRSCRIRSYPSCPLFGSISEVPASALRSKPPFRRLRKIAQATIANPPRMRQGQTRGVRMVIKSFPDTPKEPRMPRTFASNPKHERQCDGPHPLQQNWTQYRNRSKGMARTGPLEMRSSTDVHEGTVFIDQREWVIGAVHKNRGIETSRL